MLPALLLCWCQPTKLPTLEVTHDNTPITQSCRIVIAPGLVIRDTDHNGVLHINADDITVEFAEGTRLVCDDFANAWDTLTSVGIRVDNHKNVTLKNLNIAGCKLGVWATHADSLTIDLATVTDNFRQHLSSTPWAEDSSDWLWPHENDKREWATNYGAAVLVERSDTVTIQDVTVRRSQNGIMLDRVNRARIYDNDCSFLSGWGLSMWRSSHNTISRNAFDFCVRGHSEGVYNRGQDSAGILCFEQCSNNTFIENSATHSGDGFFGFAGKEALGDTPAPTPDFDYTRRGCNDNLFVGNDFSYAPAHGLELTFSFDNMVVNNTFTENAICGVWAGYSQNTVIGGNTFTANGLPRKREGGGINIELGYKNTIAGNTFERNTVAVALWSDDDEATMRLPWAKANHKGSTENRVERCTLTGNDTDIRLRKTPLTGITKNTPDARIDADEESKHQPFDLVANVWPTIDIADDAIGSSHHVGARATLAGRANILMDDWGPWDHQSPLVRVAQRTTRAVTYEVRGTSKDLYAENLATGEKEYWSTTPTALEPLKLTIPADGAYTDYAYRLVDGAWSKELRGSIVQATWRATFFANPADPRTDEPAWRAGATSPTAITVTLPALDLPFGYNGPARTVKLLDPVAAKPLEAASLRPNQFGMIASTTIPLPAGTWKFTVESDDGVRLRADGTTLIENWTLHGPAQDEALFTTTEPRDVTLDLNYFQLEGFAVLRVSLERVPDPVPSSPHFR